MGGAQTKIQHLSSQRSNKAQKSGAFTIIQCRKASRNRLLSQVVRTSSSLFFQLFKFLTPLAGSLVVLKAVALIELSCFLLWDTLTSFLVQKSVTAKTTHTHTNMHRARTHTLVYVCTHTEHIEARAHVQIQTESDKPSTEICWPETLSGMWSKDILRRCALMLFTPSYFNQFNWPFQIYLAQNSLSGFKNRTKWSFGINWGEV